MRPWVVLLPTLLALGPACAHWQPVRRAEREREPAPETAPRPQPPDAPPPSTRPAIADRAGLAALQRWTRECYDLGLRHDPIFARGGRLLVKWQADREGHLLSMDFMVDSFRGWALNAAGETLADCVVARARDAPVRWSQSGSAPLRLEAPR
jgi:hypothetical protein